MFIAHMIYPNFANNINNWEILFRGDMDVCVANWGEAELIFFAPPVTVPYVKRREDDVRIL